MNRTLIIVIIVVLVGATAAAFRFGPDQLRVWEAERAAANLMRDPKHAEITDVHIRKAAVCGMINGRNGYGAMAGAVPFIYRAKTGAELAPSHLSTSDEYKASMKQLCDIERDMAAQQGDVGSKANSSSCAAYKKSLTDEITYLKWTGAAQDDCSDSAP